MTLIRKGQALVQAGVLIAVLLAACAPATPATTTVPKATPAQTPGGTAAPVHLTLWHPYGGTMGKQFEALVAGFNQSHPDISVEPVYGGSLWTMHDKLMVAIAGKAAPDMAVIDQFWSSELADADAIIPAEQFLNSDATVDRQAIWEPAWQTATYDGQAWSMPFAVSQIVLYYNRDLFSKAGLDPDRPPATWEDLRKAAQALTRDGNGDGVPEQWGLTFPLKASEGVVYYWIAMLWQAGGELFSPDYKAVRFQQPAGVETLSYVQQLVHDGSLPLAPPENGFDKGQIGMTLASSARLAAEIQALGDRLGVAPLPCGQSCATGIGGANLAILARSPHPQEAWEFIRWMSSAEVNLRWSMQSGYLPLRRAVIDSEQYRSYLAGEPRAKVILDQMDVARARPNVPSYSGVSRELGLAVEQALFNDSGPVHALQGAAERSGPLLSGSQ